MLRRQGDPSAKRREVLIVAFAPRLTGDVNYLLTVGNDGQCLLWTYRLDTLVFELVVRALIGACVPNTPG